MEIKANDKYNDYFLTPDDTVLEVSWEGEMLDNDKLYRLTDSGNFYVGNVSGSNAYQELVEYYGELESLGQYESLEECLKDHGLEIDSYNGQVSQKELEINENYWEVFSLEEVEVSGLSERNPAVLCGTFTMSSGMEHQFQYDTRNGLFEIDEEVPESILDEIVYCCDEYEVSKEELNIGVSFIEYPSYSSDPFFSCRILVNNDEFDFSYDRSVGEDEDPLRVDSDLPYNIYDVVCDYSRDVMSEKAYELNEKELELCEAAGVHINVNEDKTEISFEDALCKGEITSPVNIATEAYEILWKDLQFINADGRDKYLDGYPESISQMLEAIEMACEEALDACSGNSSLEDKLAAAEEKAVNQEAKENNNISKDEMAM